MITAFVPAWKRLGHIPRIVDALKGQTVDVKVVIVYNGLVPSAPGWHRKMLGNYDDVWQSPFNAGPFQKFLVAKNYDGWLYFNDDDVLPATDDYIERMVRIAEGKGGRITGVRGRDVVPYRPYYRGLPDSTGWVNNVKMISALMHRVMLSEVRIPPADWLLRNDDIWVSLEVGGGGRVHWVDAALNRDLQDLPQKGVGLSQEVEHYEERSLGVKQWFEEYSS